MKLSIAFRLVFRLLPKRTKRFLTLLTLVRTLGGLLDAVFVYYAIVLARDGVEAVLSPSIYQILTASGFVVLRTAVTIFVTLLQDRILGHAEVSIVEELLLADIEAGRLSTLSETASNATLLYTTGAHVAVMSFLGAISICVSEIVALASVLIIMFEFNPLAPLVLGAAIAASFWLVKSAVNKRLENYGRDFQHHQLSRMNLIESMSNIRRELRTSNSQGYFLQLHKVAHRSQVYYSRKLNLLITLPRLVLDLGLIVVVCLLVVSNALLVQSDEFMSSLVLVGASAYRVMPSATAVVTSLGVIRRALGESQIFMRDVERRHAPTSQFWKATRAGRLLSPQFINVREIVRFNNITYRNERGDLILDHFSLSVRSGERVLIYGNSGVGKSTIFDLMIGEIAPQEGSIQLFGLPPDEAVLHLPKKIGIVPQNPKLIAGDVFSNVALGSKREPNAENQVNKILGRVGLDSSSFPITSENVDVGLVNSLSGGEKQRIAIARVLYQSPELVILDEPTSALDASSQRLVIDAINDLNATVIVISHEVAYHGWATKKVHLDASVRQA